MWVTNHLPFSLSLFCLVLSVDPAGSRFGHSLLGDAMERIGIHSAKTSGYSHLDEAEVSIGIEE